MDELQLLEEILINFITLESGRWKKKECPLAPVEVNIYELAIMKRHRDPFFFFYFFFV